MKHSLSCLIYYIKHCKLLLHELLEEAVLYYNINKIYNKLTKLFFSNSDKDVIRTDRKLSYYKEGPSNPNVKKLYDILMTYCMYNFDLGKLFHFFLIIIYN